MLSFLTQFPRWFAILYLTFLICTFSGKLSAQLSGTYTIDPAGGGFPNFTSINGALDSIYSQGISGPVEFNLVDGAYSTSFGLGAVPGASSVNTITFQGNESDSTKVKLYNHGGWAVIALMGDGAAHFRFRKMHMEVDGTGDNVILWCYRTENTKDIVFESCLLEGKFTTNQSPQQAIVFIDNQNSSGYRFRNCYFVNGSAGIWINSFGPAQTIGLEVSGCFFQDQNLSGIDVRQCQRPGC